MTILRHYVFSQETPRSSGVKVQDIWFLSCILFVLSAILEYAMCLFLKRTMTRRKRKLQTKLQQTKDGSAGGNSRLFARTPQVATVTTTTDSYSMYVLPDTF